MLSAWTRQYDKREVMRMVGNAGVPAGAVFDSMELIQDTNFDDRAIMQTMQHPKAGPFKMPAWPVRFDGRPPEVKPSPILGANTADVLGTWLGRSERDIAALKEKKIAG